MLSNRRGEEAVKARSFLCVELVDVVRRDELDFGPLGEGARLIEDEATSTDPGSQRVRHRKRIARARASPYRPCHTRHTTRSYRPGRVRDAARVVSVGARVASGSGGGFVGRGGFAFLGEVPAEVASCAAPLGAGLRKLT